MNSFHVTTKSIDKCYLPIPMLQAWSDVTKKLKDCHQKQGLSVHAFVLMGNHFHLLCHPRWATLEDCLAPFLKNNIWDPSYNWSSINSHRHYLQVYRYIYQNPLRAKLVYKVEDYPFSTLRSDLPFPLHSRVSMNFCGEEGERFWLNQRYRPDFENSIRQGLKKRNFEMDAKFISEYMS